MKLNLTDTHMWKERSSDLCRESYNRTYSNKLPLCFKYIWNSLLGINCPVILFIEYLVQLKYDKQTIKKKTPLWQVSKVKV